MSLHTTRRRKLVYKAENFGTIRIRDVLLAECRTRLTRRLGAGNQVEKLPDNVIATDSQESLHYFWASCAEPSQGYTKAMEMLKTRLRNSRNKVFDYGA